MNSARFDACEKDPLPRRLADAEPERLRDPPVEVLEAVQDLRHDVADAVVVVDEGLPRRAEPGSVARAMPARIAHSDRSSGDAGCFIPCERCTMLIESSTVTPCSPLRWKSFSLRPRQGRMSALPPVNEMAAVELGAHLHREIAAAQGGERLLRVGRRQR